MSEPTKIILIDVQPVVRAGLRTMLGLEANVEIVGEADSAHEAVLMINTAMPDVLIMDAALLGAEQSEALRAIKAATPRLRILALSSAADSRSLTDSLQAGAVGYVTKDCGAEELRLAIRTVIARKVYLSPRATGLLVDQFLNGRRAESERRLATALTRRERQVVQRIAEGQTSREIASSLTLSVRTIDALRQQVMEKLDIRTVAELTKYAIREGLTVLDG